MHPRRLDILSILVAALLPLAAHAALSGGGGEPATTKPDPTERVAHLPEANPYRAVAMRWLSLPEEDRKAISEWADFDPSAETAPTSLSPAQTEIARAIAAGIRTASATNAAIPELWPLKIDPKDPGNPYMMLVPDVGAMRALARVTVKVADTSSTAEAISLYAATARFGRDLRSGATLIQGLTGIAVEGIASAGPARRLTEFTPQELESLSAAWRALPEPASIEHALHAERNVFFGPIMESIILPGLLALQSEGIDKLTAKSDYTSRIEASPTLKNFRLSGLVEADGEQRIHIENVATGEVFAVTDKQPAEGMELIRFDAKERRAWLRVKGTPVLLDLESKRFVSAHTDIDRLRKFLGEDQGNEAPREIPDWVRKALAHPDGPEGYVTDLTEEYDRRMAAQIVGAQQAKMPQRSPQDEITDQLLATVMPSFGAVVRTFNASELQPIMLQAAILQRLGQADRMPADPWSKTASTPDQPTTPAPFTIESSPDGGLILRSVYERRADEPYTYKFGTPDAGVQRKPAAK